MGFSTFHMDQLRKVGRRHWKERLEISKIAKLKVMPLNPFSPNSDQNQFSPNDIHTLSRDYVIRIDKVITKGKMLRSFIKFS